VLVIVDYLQLVAAPREVKDRRLQVEAVSLGLKTLALQHRIPLLCLSSVSRPAAGNPEPSLSSLRESGELEHDADVVLLLHRPVEEGEEVVCRIAKNRSGAVGKVSLTFRPAWVTFDERILAPETK
jgi:replicative DNA helicase